MSKFNQLKNKLAKKPGVTNPAGLAAKIGMDKLGKKAFEAKAQAGKKFEAKDKMADKKAGIKEGGKVDMKKDMKGKK